MDKSLKLEPADSSEERKTPQISTDSPPPSPLSQTLELSPNDDDSITTSTESSDTFEAWTLVMDKQKLKAENRVDIVKDNDHVDEDEAAEEAEESKDKELHDSSNDVTADDLSDGISIISESESNGRVSPHPYLRDHLQDLNLRFATAQYDDNDDKILHKLGETEAETERPYPTPVIVTNVQQIRQRTGRRTFNESQENNTDATLQHASQVVLERNYIPPLLKRGLQGIFYIGVAVAILGLIGRIRNPIWQPLAGNNNPSSAELEQKVNDMELQNNLMRAEIDLLNKQVKYLSNLNEPQQQKKSGKYKGQYEEPKKEGKTFKAWSGNGETLKSVEITKDDLKRPYKCPDGSYTEIAGMCVEKQRTEPNIIRQYEDILDELKRSETLQTFDKVAKELHGITENPFEHLEQFFVENNNQQPEQQDSASKVTQEQQQLNEQRMDNKPIYKDDHLSLNDHKPLLPEEGQFQHIPSGYEKCKDPSDTKCFDKKEFKRPYDGEKKSHKQHYESHLNEKFDKLKNPKNEKNPKFARRINDDDDEDSKEYYNKRHNESKERYLKRNDESTERHHKRNEDDSKDRYQKRHDDSKERFIKRSKENSSKERVRKQKAQDSGEWQEQYMKHRENVRKENEQKYYGDNKNWYIKRGDGRENKRNADDIRYR